MVTHNAYLDRPLEILVEKWALAHKLTKTVTLPDGSEVEEADVDGAVVAILREYFQVQKPKEPREKEKIATCEHCGRSWRSKSPSPKCPYCGELEKITVVKK
jgi:hypothetical protein